MQRFLAASPVVQQSSELSDWSHHQLPGKNGNIYLINDWSHKLKKYAQLLCIPFTPLFSLTTSRKAYATIHVVNTTHNNKKCINYQISIYHNT